MYVYGCVCDFYSPTTTQIAFIVSLTGVQFSRYLKHMIIPTVVVLAAHIAMLLFSYRWRLFRDKPMRSSVSVITLTGSVNGDDDAVGAVLMHASEHEIELTSLMSHHESMDTISLHQDDNNTDPNTNAATITTAAASSSASTSSSSKPSAWWMQYLIATLMVLTVVLLLLPASVGYFDIGLIPFAAGLCIVVVDRVVFHNDSSIVFNHLDWPILLLFMGLFVWLQVCTSSSSSSLS